MTSNLSTGILFDYNHTEAKTDGYGSHTRLLRLQQLLQPPRHPLPGQDRHQLHHRPAIRRKHRCRLRLPARTRLDRRPHPRPHLHPPRRRLLQRNRRPRRQSRRQQPERQQPPQPPRRTRNLPDPRRQRPLPTQFHRHVAARVP
jgi:hypothetical protein